MHDLEKCIQDSFNDSLFNGEQIFALSLIAEGNTRPVASDDMRRGAEIELGLRRAESRSKPLKAPAAR